SRPSGLSRQTGSCFCASLPVAGPERDFVSARSYLASRCSVFKDRTSSVGSLDLSATAVPFLLLFGSTVGDHCRLLVRSTSLSKFAPRRQLLFSAPPRPPACRAPGLPSKGRGF